jgi:succinate dehydrogenase / fumarate reductase, cytochrome b subunit
MIPKYLQNSENAQTNEYSEQIAGLDTHICIRISAAVNFSLFQFFSSLTWQKLVNAWLSMIARKTTEQALHSAFKPLKNDAAIDLRKYTSTGKWGGISMTQNQTRPISPHLMQYRWGVHMMASIVHRATGFILATAGMLTLVWWLSAISGGAESYATFQRYAIAAGDGATGWQVASNWFFRLAGFAIVYAFFQHFYFGLRHLVMDMGAGFELATNRMWSQLVFVAALLSAIAAALLVAMRFTGV